MVDITLVVEIVATVSGVCLGFFGIYTYYRDCKRNSQRDTLEAYSRLQKETLCELNKWMPSEIKKSIEDKKSDGYKELSGYLADIERFCVGINEGIYDFKTFYEVAHGYFDNERGGLVSRLLPLIESKNDYAKEDYFSNIHMVWKKMNKKSWDN